MNFYKIIFVSLIIPLAFCGSTIRINAVGDIMMGTNFPKDQLPPENGAYLFAHLKNELINANIVFGNLEGPILDGGKSEKCKSDSNCYAFRTPTRFAGRLKEAGFNMLSLANNHANDFGDSGRVETMDILDSLGIKHSGPIGDIAVFDMDSIKIVFIAFCTAEHSFNLLDIETSTMYIKGLKERFDIVVVSFHGGCEGESALHVKNEKEYCYGEDRGNVVKFAHLSVDAGADLVLGHGPHVPRAMEIYHDKLIAYSLGNFCTYERFKVITPNGLSLILQIEISPIGNFVCGKIIPLRLDSYGVPILDPSNETIRLIQQLTAEDFPDNSIRIHGNGNIENR